MDYYVDEILPSIRYNDVDEIIPGKLYLGNVQAAMSGEFRRQKGITHIVSVCTGVPSTGENHLSIPIEDWERVDILTHLPNCNEFIQNALDCGGAVLVHCFMGISRSTTAVAAYLMKSRNLTASAAIRFIKQHRSVVHPNYGFLFQLDAFHECGYDPTITNPAYIAWRDKHTNVLTGFLDYFSNIIEIIPGKLSLSAQFPDDSEAAEALLDEFGITHLVTLFADETPLVLSSVKHRHFNLKIPYTESSDEVFSEKLLLALPEACGFIRDALADRKGRVLLYSVIEYRAWAVICAYLMSSRNMAPNDSYKILEDALPLFNTPVAFMDILNLFNTCGYSPSSDHPLVQACYGTQIRRVLEPLAY